MTSGKAASRQPGSPHSFLCQLPVQDDSPLKLFGGFSINPTPPGHSSCGQPAPPHPLGRSAEVPAARAPGALDLGQKSHPAASGRLFEALTCFPLPSGRAAGGKPCAEHEPFAPSSAVTQPWLGEVALCRWQASVCRRFPQQTSLAGTPRSATLLLPSRLLCPSGDSWPQELPPTPHLLLLLSPGCPAALISMPSPLPVLPAAVPT